MESGSRSNTESPSVFVLAALGFFMKSKYLHSSSYPVKLLRGRQSTGGVGQGQTETYASVNFHIHLETEQALYSFLTSHLPTLWYLMATSGGSLFFISHRSFLRVCFADCQQVSVVQNLTGARGSVKGQEAFTISHDLSQFDRRPGKTDHIWVVGWLLTTLTWGFPSIMVYTVIRG